MIESRPLSDLRHSPEQHIDLVLSGRDRADIVEAVVVDSNRVLVRVPSGGRSIVHRSKPPAVVVVEIEHSEFARRFASEGRGRRHVGDFDVREGIHSIQVENAACREGSEGGEVQLRAVFDILNSIETSSDVSEGEGTEKTIFDTVVFKPRDRRIGRRNLHSVAELPTPQLQRLPRFGEILDLDIRLLEEDIELIGAIGKIVVCSVPELPLRSRRNRPGRKIEESCLLKLEEIVLFFRRSARGDPKLLGAERVSSVREIGREKVPVFHSEADASGDFPGSVDGRLGGSRFSSLRLRTRLHSLSNDRVRLGRCRLDCRRKFRLLGRFRRGFALCIRRADKNRIDGIDGGSLRIDRRIWEDSRSPCKQGERYQSFRWL